jgi:hypothetical protein
MQGILLVFYLWNFGNVPWYFLPRLFLAPDNAMLLISRPIFDILGLPQAVWHLLVLRETKTRRNGAEEFAYPAGQCLS